MRSRREAGAGGRVHAAVPSPRGSGREEAALASDVEKLNRATDKAASPQPLAYERAQRGGGVIICFNTQK
jgi:hypothetical protein